MTAANQNSCFCSYRQIDRQTRQKAQFCIVLTLFPVFMSFKTKEYLTTDSTAITAIGAWLPFSQTFEKDVQTKYPMPSQSERHTLFLTKIGQHHTLCSRTSVVHTYTAHVRV